jgi:hypothetical protein
VGFDRSVVFAEIQLSVNVYLVGHADEGHLGLISEQYLLVPFVSLPWPMNCDVAKVSASDGCP